MIQTEPTRRAYRLHEFCKAFGIGETKARELIRANRLKAKKMGRAVLITDEAARDWANSLPDAA
jgi:excisionase family DNA binding protein